MQCHDPEPLNCTNWYIVFPDTGCLHDLGQDSKTIDGVQVLDISILECRKQSAECLRLRAQPGVSSQKATILLTMARTWTALANHKERLDGLQRELDPSLEG